MKLNNKLLRFICIFAPVVFSTFYSMASYASVIYQAHNLKFTDIEKMLPDLSAKGITHIQVSPPQKSNPSSAWWARYQPVDFRVIEGPLGSEQALQSLISTAHKFKQQVIIDVVLNHMANYSALSCVLEYPLFGRFDFHGDCYSHAGESDDRIKGWLGGDLPDLRTESEWVRTQAKDYLQRLINLGADGFRYDAAKHIEPSFFAEMNTLTLAQGKFSYGEVIANYTDINLAWDYTKYMSVTDYPLTARMFDAFSYGGDLRILKWPSQENRALPGVSAVTFANNHDIFEHPGDFRNIALNDVPTVGGRPSDRILANAYILGRQEGMPLLFRDDIFDGLVGAGIKFHEQMLPFAEYMRDANEYGPLANSPNYLFIERGANGIVIINKSENWLTMPSVYMPGLDEGCFKELQYGFSMQVGFNSMGEKVITRWGNDSQGGLRVGPRNALFFVKSKCY